MTDSSRSRTTPCSSSTRPTTWETRTPATGSARPTTLDRQLHAPRGHRGSQRKPRCRHDHLRHPRPRPPRHQCIVELQDTGDITIDGTTQPGYAGTRIVEVRGPGDADSQAIFGAGDNVTIKGLSITNWGAAVTLLGSGGVQDSWLGVEPGGALRANLNVGVVLEGTGASVVRSRIAGGRCGIFITASLNGGCGITPGDVQAASGNTIGGDASTGAGNTIYGFTVAGVFVSGAGAGNTIQGNVIGLTPAGTPSGGGNGVFIRDALGTVVGANAGPGDLYILNPNLGNVVAGITTEGNRGIAVLGTSSGTRIAANSVGTDRAGTATDSGSVGRASSCPERPGSRSARATRSPTTAARESRSWTARATASSRTRSTTTTATGSSSWTRTTDCRRRRSRTPSSTGR